MGGKTKYNISIPELNYKCKMTEKKLIGAQIKLRKAGFINTRFRSNFKMQLLKRICNIYLDYRTPLH